MPPPPSSPPQQTETLLQLRGLQRGSDVAVYFGASWGQLRYLLYRAKPEHRYRAFVLKKKSGGTRIIHAPVPQLKQIQRAVCLALSRIYRPKAPAHGFLKNHSVATNAKHHLNSRLVLNLDLKDFFPTIHLGRIIGMLIKEPYVLPRSVATIIAQIACKDGRLPQGAPTSPVLSNMICARLDGELGRLARSVGAYYTRYADDITFSTNQGVLPVALGVVTDNKHGTVETVGSRLDGAIIANGFTVNTAKTRLMSNRQCQLVTGVKVNAILNVRRTYIRNIRAMLFSWRTAGYSAAMVRHNSLRQQAGKRPADLRRVIHGKLSYLRMLKGPADPIWTKLYEVGRILEERDVSAGMIDTETVYFRARHFGVPAAFNHLSGAVWVVENAELEQGSAFAITNRCLLTCAHCIKGETTLVNPSRVHERHKLRVIATDDDADVAVVMLDSSEIAMRHLQLEFRIPTIGEVVTVVGFPDFAPGSSPSITQSRITARQFRFRHPIVMVDSPIYGGTSGGPVLGLNGKVVGMAARGPKPHATDHFDVMNWVIPLLNIRGYLPVNITL